MDVPNNKIETLGAKMKVKSQVQNCDLCNHVCSTWGQKSNHKHYVVYILFRLNSEYLGFILILSLSFYQYGFNNYWIVIKIITLSYFKEFDHYLSQKPAIEPLIWV